MSTSPDGARKSSLRVFHSPRDDPRIPPKASIPRLPFSAFRSPVSDFPLRNLPILPKNRGTNLPKCFEIRL